ncbi:MAG TPA: MarR family transcriptional regulator [Chthoniobacterales bacterium]|nr:MarR family transcriptional regulator [Chthoniobacterales bacterium]
MTRSLQAEDYDALADFRYAMRKFLSFSKRTLAHEAKLTPEQYEALLALKAFSASTGLTIGDLSERLQVKHNTAVGIVDKLEAISLLQREPGVLDRRQVFLKLTPEGDRLLAGLAAIHREEMRMRSPEMIEALVRLQK